MMCREVREGSVVEDYLTGKLAPAAREAFELHYFGCDSCFGDLQAARTLQSALRVQRRTEPVNSGLRTRYWLWAVAAAAVLLIAVIALQPRQSPKQNTARTLGNQNAPDYSQLARFDPPPYSADTLRGGTPPQARAFRAAMQHYADHDYKGCQAALRRMSATEAQYYLGICELLASNNAAGIGTLQRVVAAGDTPYLEEARFYLAKALLADKDLPDAKQVLQAVAAMHGDLEKEAETLLSQLP